MSRNEDTEVVYRFSELSERAKDRVRDRHMDWACGLDSGEDYLESLKALAEHFNGSVRDWSTDWSGGSYSWAKFSMPEIDEFVDVSEAEDENGDVDEGFLEELHRVEIQRRLDKLGDYNPKTLMGTGEYKLTGMGTDESVIDGFRKAFVAGESDLDALMHAAFDSMMSAAQKDYEYIYSDEALTETCDANDAWFDENGYVADPPDPGKGRYSQSALDRIRQTTTPHGRCRPGNCIEHMQDPRVPRCPLGRRARTKRRTKRRN